MIKSELVRIIAQKNTYLYQRDVEHIVNTVLEEISSALANGNRVELRGFGSFFVKSRESRIGRNPRTGEQVDIEEKNVPFFKTGKNLRERINKELDKLSLDQETRISIQNDSIEIKNRKRISESTLNRP